MKTLSVYENNAIKAYNGADEKGKELLVNLFGKDVLSVKITDRVKTFEDACQVNGTTPDEILPYSSPKNKDQEAANAFAKLCTIAKALNEGWVPDWKNSSQYKYYPWFEADSSGGGFSFCDDDCWRTSTVVGSRLCFKSGELATYAGKQFIKEYNQFLTL